MLEPANKKAKLFFETKYDSSEFTFSTDASLDFENKLYTGVGVFANKDLLVLSIRKNEKFFEIPMKTINRIDKKDKMLSKNIIVTTDKEEYTIDFTFKKDRDISYDQLVELMNKNYHEEIEHAITDNSIKVNVAGLNHDHHQKNLRSVINSMVDELESYEGLGKEEIEDICIVDGSMSKYDSNSLGHVYLEFEPENEFDKNAIRVVFHNEYIENTKVGYIPKTHIDIVKNKMKNPYSVTAYIDKGDYKYWDEEKEIVKEEKGNYYLNLFIVSI